MNTIVKKQKRIHRHKRIRSKIFGTSDVPRLCVFRSHQHIYAQLIDDKNQKVLLSANDFGMTEKTQTKKKTEAEVEKETKEGKKKEELNGKKLKAFKVGKLIAEKALAKKIEKVVFDRNGYKYHGRVKALSEGARQGGLKF